MGSGIVKMTKVVFKKLNGKARQSRRRVGVKRVRNAKGVASFVVDAASQTFPTDIRYVFSKNVSRARKENKQTLGSPDLVPPSD